jgi:hypothetical protein
MARWSGARNNWTPTAVADTTAFTDGGYMALQGGTTTQRINLLEVYMGGLAAASAAAQMILARDSTIGVTALAGALGPNGLDAASAALAAPPVFFSSSTTKPGRSNTAQLLMLGFNAFGGIVRWVAAPGEEIGMLGTAASNGELSLSSASTGTPGLMNSHFIIEPF